MELSYFELVQDARDYTYTEQGMADCCDVMMYLAEAEILDDLKDVADGTIPHDYRAKAVALLMTLQTRENLDVANPKVVEWLGYFPDYIDATNIAVLQMLGQRQMQPYATVTAYAFNAAKGVESTLQTPYTRSLSIEILTALEEKAPVTVWAVQDGFADINLGKTTWIQDACKYAITSIPSVPSGYSLELRVNMPEVDWSVS